MADRHLSYSEFKAIYGDLGVTEWVKYNWLANYHIGPSYQVDIDEVPTNTVVTGDGTYPENATVVIKLNLAEGCVWGDDNAPKANGNAMTVDGDGFKYEFTMPDEDVLITFTGVEAISINYTYNWSTIEQGAHSQGGSTFTHITADDLYYYGITADGCVYRFSRTTNPASINFSERFRMIGANGFTGVTGKLADGNTYLCTGCYDTSWDAGAFYVLPVNNITWNDQQLNYTFESGQRAVGYYYGNNEFRCTFRASTVSGSSKYQLERIWYADNQVKHAYYDPTTEFAAQLTPAELTDLKANAYLIGCNYDAEAGWSYLYYNNGSLVWYGAHQCAAVTTSGTSYSLNAEFVNTIDDNTVAMYGLTSADGFFYWTLDANNDKFVYQSFVNNRKVVKKVPVRYQGNDTYYFGTSRTSSNKNIYGGIDIDDLSTTIYATDQICRCLYIDPVTNVVITIDNSGIKLYMGVPQLI